MATPKIPKKEKVSALKRAQRLALKGGRDLSERYGKSLKSSKAARLLNKAIQGLRIPYPKGVNPAGRLSLVNRSLAPLGKGLLGRAALGIEGIQTARKVFNPNDNIALSAANVVQAARGGKAFGTSALAQAYNAKRDLRIQAEADGVTEAAKERDWAQLTDGTIAKTIQQFNKPGDVKPGEITVDPSLDDQKGVNTKWMPSKSYDISNGLPTGTDITNQPPNQFQQKLTTAPQDNLKIQDPGSNWVGRGTDVRMPDGGSTVLTEHSGDFKWKNLQKGDNVGVMSRNERKAYDKAAKAAQKAAAKAAKAAAQAQQLKINPSAPIPGAVVT